MIMHSFDFVVVGAGGGPDETNLSAYLFKPYDKKWEDGIVALEAGSGQGTLAHLMRKNPTIFSSIQPEESSPKCSKVHSASDIYSFVRCFLLTHAHLDHINSLVISAGSLCGPRRRVYSLKQTLENLELVFSDRIWPNLASWKEDDDQVKLLYSTLVPDAQYTTIFSDVSVRAMPINHGKNALGEYESTAFFIRHDPSLREFLFFGDVEPDSVAEKPRTINVWRAAASKIPETLSTLFIECSYPSGRPDNLLFGHLTPEHLVSELCVLAQEVVAHRRQKLTDDTRKRPVRKRQKLNSITSEDLKGALLGFRVCIIHCKDDASLGTASPIREVILTQVRQLVEAKKLGAKVFAAEQGACISI